MRNVNKMASIFVGRGRLRLFFIFIFFCSSLTVSFRYETHAAWAAQTVSVELPSVVYSTDGAFTLGEISNIKGPAKDVDVLSSLIISVNDGFIPREQVLNAISASGLEDVRVELRMPSRVRVESPGPEGNGTELSYTPYAPDASLSSMIKSLAAWDGEVEVTTNAPVPAGRLVEPASIVPGSPAATLRFRDSKGRVRSLAVRMTWAQNVLVAARTIPRGTPIRPHDLMLRLMKITRPGVYASNEAQAVGHVSRKELKQGEPIPLDVLSGPRAVKKGRKVKIVARFGGLTAVSEGTLMDDGSPGDEVRVRRSGNKKAVLRAHIVDENTVEVNVQ